MSKLIVEVCRIDNVKDHPNADRMKLATIKGWQVCIKHDPQTGISEFQEGDLCMFFPPDSILQPALFNRIGCGKYLNELPKDELGVRPEGKRVTATRLRGIPSYGVIAKIDPSFGDDPNWTVGTDLIEHFGITKYEPPLESTEGDAEKSNNLFFGYNGPENFGNYPNAFEEGEEVIFTEKIHGKNCRIGYVLQPDENGLPVWTWMAGSNSVRRKEFVNVTHRFSLDYLTNVNCQWRENYVFPQIDAVFDLDGKSWRVDEIIEPKEESLEQVLKLQVTQVDGRPVPHCQEILKRSEYWEPLTENMKKMIQQILIKEMDQFDGKSAAPNSVIVYGEIYGAGVQDMTYGLTGRSFRVFDIAVNNKYLDHDVKNAWCVMHGIETVPILYRGPFSVQRLEEFTNGPTTMCAKEKAGKFAGREGIVITPVKEVSYCPKCNGRKIIKSVSADYLARRDGTEFH